MLSSHERNQAYAELLRPGAPLQEPFHRKAAAAMRRLDRFTVGSLLFFVACLLFAWHRL